MDELRINEVTLPSGKKAKIVNYFIRAEKIAVEKDQWGEAQADIDDTGAVKFKGIPINHLQLKENAVVIHGTKEIDGQPSNAELVNNLPNDDFNFLFEKLAPIYTGKKKTTSEK